MKKELKSYKKLSFFFSFAIHAIILGLLIEGNKKKLIPKTSMIEVELKSSYQNTKEMPKIDNSDTLKSIDRNMATKRQTPSISNKTNIPILAIGSGEQISDLIDFDPEQFSNNFIKN